MTDRDLKKTEQRILRRGNLPRHIAIIMDGNGRWARRRGLPRVAGHRAGIKAVRDIVRTCTDLGVSHLTLYTFSVENWKRPAAEVNALMRFLRQTLRKETEELDSGNVSLGVIGRTEDLPSAVRAEIERAEDHLRKNDGLVLTLALSYAGRAEIVDAVRRLIGRIRNGTLTDTEVDEDLLASFLYTADLPDPDLLIRTSGDMRISNFLLWQLAYSELWFTETLWPDFRRGDLYEAVMSYQERERRFGRVTAEPPSKS
jgi:undecaprenyl diphosphate synthase